MARGLLVGRFQPFHRGHLGVLRALRAARPDETLLLGIGSAQASYTFRDPFTAGERTEMIERALDAERLGGWRAVPLVDLDRHALWVAHLESLLPAFERVYTNNPLTRLLFERAGYAVEAPTLVDRGRYEGTAIRRLLADGGGWADRVPPALVPYLDLLGAPARLRLLRGPPAAPAAP